MSLNSRNHADEALAGSGGNTVGSEFFRICMACLVTLFAVSTVFMNQSIFLELSQSFAIDLQEARFSFSWISLFYGLAFLLIGPIADTFAFEKVASFGLLCLSVLYVFAAQAQSYAMFLACMACMGWAAAFVPATMFPYVALISPPKKLGMYVGAVVASATVGIILGRVSLGIMTDVMGWRASYLVFSGLLGICAVVVFFVLRGGGAVQRKARPSLLPLYGNMVRLVCSPRVAILLMTGFFLFFGFMGAVTFLTYRLVGPSFGFSAGQVGYISFVGLVAMVAPFAGEVTQRVGVLRVFLPAFGLCLAALQILGWSMSVPVIALGLLLLFMGVYTCQPVLFLVIGRIVPKESLGCASSLYILFCIGGGSLSSVVLGDVWQAYGWEGIVVASTASLLAGLGSGYWGARRM